MSTWVAVIAETKGAKDFWSAAAKHGVEAKVNDVPARVLIDCGMEFGKVRAFAEELSKKLESECIAFAAQTSADVYFIWVFRGGNVVRELTYNRDEGGWSTASGAPQPWEPAFFFESENDGMLDDDISEADMARYREAKEKKDASPILDLLHLSSTEPLIRLCEFFGIDGGEPSGIWKPPFWPTSMRTGFFARLFGSK